MSDHPRIPRADALALAGQLLAHLAPACERIEIAGSLRRMKEDVSDIDIVAIARAVRETDLFGEPSGPRINQLDAALADINSCGFIRRWNKNGPLLRSFDFGADGLPTMTVELSIVRPETWAAMFMMKTGNAVFSHWMVTSQAAGGALPFGYKVADGRLWHLGAHIDTPEEPDLFAAISLPYIPPADRSAFDYFQRGRP